MHRDQLEAPRKGVWRRRWTLPLAIAALAGCVPSDSGDDSPPDSDAAPFGAPDGSLGLDAAPPMCNDLPGWVITAVDAPAPCIGRVPIPGERVSADSRLRVAGLDLPIVGGDCETLEAYGCMLESEFGNRHEVRGTLDVDAGRLVLDGQQVARYRSADCAPVTLSLAPEPIGCVLGGHFDVPMPLSPAEGMCDLTWREATVSIILRADGSGVIRWGNGRSLDINAVDRDACTVTADAGILLFNGVRRTIDLTAIIDGDRVGFTIDDALAETSSFDEECPGARFVGEGTRIGPDGPALVAACDSLPFVCGDGVCAADAGEQCRNCREDCGCGDALCLKYRYPYGPDGAPFRYTCAEMCPTCDADGRCVECGVDERCVFIREFEGEIFHRSPMERVCLPATGSAPPGGTCEDSRGCANRLACMSGRCLEWCIDVDPDMCDECIMPWRLPIEVCLPAQ